MKLMENSKKPERHAVAFTFVELVVVLGVVSAGILLAVPLIAGSALDSQRAVCANNLRRIGQALTIWGSDHGELYPWQIDYVEGGTRFHPVGSHYIWFQFSWISNELATPKIMACPSDRLAKTPEHFGGGPGGFLSAPLRDAAVSYNLSHPFAEDGRLILSGDRSMDGFSRSFGCSYLASPGQPFLSVENLSLLRWRNIMHFGSGNLLFNDGAVELSDTQAMREAMARYFSITNTSRSSSPHFQTPYRAAGEHEN